MKAFRIYFSIDTKHRILTFAFIIDTSDDENSTSNRQQRRRDVNDDAADDTMVKSRP